MARRKRQIHPYLAPDLHRRFVDYASRQEATESAVISDALLRLLDDAYDAPRVERRLNRLQRELLRQRRELVYIAETLSVFVTDWLAHTPPIPDAQRSAASASARHRWKLMLGHIAENIQGGRTSLERALPEETSVPGEAGLSSATAPVSPKEGP